MIFAHLGFASDGPALAQTIDYSMNQLQLYHAVSRYMITKGSHYELINDIGNVDPSVRLDGLSS